MELLAWAVKSVVNWLLGQGLWGITFILLLVGIYYKDCQVKQLNEDRLDDLKTIQAEQIRSEAELNTTLQTLIAVLGRRS